MLIVEDTEERQAVLTQLYRSHAWVMVDTGARAVTILNAYDFDIISLDFNLRGPLSGADVARAIAQSRNASTGVVIHSMNPNGASEISSILPQAIQFPVRKMVRSNAAFKELRERIDASGWRAFLGLA